MEALYSQGRTEPSGVASQGVNILGLGAQRKEAFVTGEGAASCREVGLPKGLEQQTSSHPEGAKPCLFIKSPAQVLMRAHHVGFLPCKPY